MTGRPRAVVTGATGYLGSRISRALEAKGWHVIGLARSARLSSSTFVGHDLGQPLSAEVCALLKSTDLLVHTAYDFSPRRLSDIWRINVGGSRRLLEAAAHSHVRRILVLSSMSAFEGTAQIYGRAKLEIERITESCAGYSIRPGLVYGANARGMAGALRKLTALPLIPLIADGKVFTVEESDLMAAIVVIAAADRLTDSTISVAHSTPVLLRDLMIALAEEEGRRPRFLKIPWRPTYFCLRAAEYLGIRLPFRADSLLGLVRPASSPPNDGALRYLGVTPRSFPATTSPRLAR